MEPFNPPGVTFLLRDLPGLREALAAQFGDVTITVKGRVALFTARS